MMTALFPEDTAAGHGDHRRPAEPPVSGKNTTARESHIEIEASLSETSRDYADTMASGSLAQQQFRMLCRHNEDVGTIVVVPTSAQPRPQTQLRGRNARRMAPIR